MEKIDLVKLDTAILYVQRIAEGYNPITNEEADEDTVLNNPHVIRCMYFVKNVLEEVRSNDGKMALTKTRSKKIAFPFEVLKEFTYQEDTSISYLLQQIHKPLEGMNVKKISTQVVTNLKYMKKFYMFYSGLNRQQSVDDLEMIYSIPWGHHIMIFTKCKDVKEAIFYVNKTLENGWSRAVLSNYLDVELYETQGKAVTNFNMVLPDEQSDVAKEILKDPYNFDFLMLKDDYKERELEDALIDNISKFLLELGRGFAYVGKQIPIMIGNREMMMDLLFYHLKLRCYIVIELKIGEFQPAYVGQLVFRHIICHDIYQKIMKIGCHRLKKSKKVFKT